MTDVVRAAFHINAKYLNKVMAYYKKFRKDGIYLEVDEMTKGQAWALQDNAIRARNFSDFEKIFGFKSFQSTKARYYHQENIYYVRVMGPVIRTPKCNQK